MKNKIHSLKDIFPDWSESDLQAVLEEANGDLQLAISRISEGNLKKYIQMEINFETETGAPIIWDSISSGHARFCCPMGSSIRKKENE